MLRTFVALNLSPEFRTELAQVVTECKSVAASEVKWVELENLHFTLQFIGDISSHLTGSIVSTVGTALIDLPEFDVFVPEIEIIPPIHKGNPRLIWVKCSYECAELKEVVKNIRAGLKDLSLEVDNKPFRMHITLGRVKKILTPEQIKRIMEIKLADYSHRIKMATLYESRLHSGGPQYIPLKRYSLAVNNRNG